MRSALPLLALIQLACHAATAQPVAQPVAQPASQAACEIASQTYDSREVACAIPASAESRRFEFIARFSGGHDDTRASIRPSLNGQPLVCDEGSKTSLFAEDGDVSLQCRFSAPADAGARLLVTVRWSHAEYTNFELLSR